MPTVQNNQRSGPECLTLSRCASCYNQRRSSRLWCQSNGESSSSAEDSGPETDSESETESSSSCSVKASSEILEEPETEKLRPASEGGGKDGDGREETEETVDSQEDESRLKTRRLSFVKSYSLPAHFPPRLIPLALLPRPHTVVSTLHLQVLSQSDDSDSFYTLKQQEENTEAGTAGGQGGISNAPPPQISRPPLQQHHLSHQHQPHHLHHLSHQHQPHHLHHLSHQHQPHHLHHLSHQHHQPQHVPAVSAQGQRLPPPLHTPPVLPPPQTHPPAPPCWYWYGMHFPHSPYWTHYG